MLQNSKSANIQIGFVIYLVFFSIISHKKSRVNNVQKGFSQDTGCISSIWETHLEILMVENQRCETERTTAPAQKDTALCFNCWSWGPESHNPGLNSVGKSFSVFC